MDIESKSWFFYFIDNFFNQDADSGTIVRKLQFEWINPEVSRHHTPHTRHQTPLTYLGDTHSKYLGHELQTNIRKLTILKDGHPLVICVLWIFANFLRGTNVMYFEVKCSNPLMINSRTEHLHHVCSPLKNSSPYFRFKRFSRLPTTFVPWQSTSCKFISSRAKVEGRSHD